MTFNMVYDSACTQCTAETAGLYNAWLRYRNIKNETTMSSIVRKLRTCDKIKKTSHMVVGKDNYYSYFNMHHVYRSINMFSSSLKNMDVNLFRYIFANNHFCFCDLI